jgi:F-type H+-transporting ATPase subunit delta
VAHEAHNSGLAARYATAIFELAQDENSLDAVDKDLTSLKAMVARSTDLARLVRAPVFSGEEQVAGLNAILNRMEAAPLTRRFILLLSKKRRLFYVTDIIRAFHAMVARQRGEVEASVTSAHALGDAEIASLKQILKSKLGRDARLEMKVDPKLLGGLVVKVGSRMIDSSLRTKLDGLRAAMRGN